jgi:PPM family protein phosphatase
MKYVCIGKTDTGLKRSKNEDALLIRPDLGVLAVADGMGGAAAGEVASTLFIKTAMDVFSRHPQSTSSLREIVEDTFRQANKKVIQHANENESQRGMGCTAELCTVSGSNYVIGHIGDSRTYLFRDGFLTQLTKDHTMVQDEVDRGLITPEQARNHMMRNIITRAIGVSMNLSTDIIEGIAYNGDQLMLCSDGLTDMLLHKEITRILVNSDPIRTAEELIDAANRAGGRDNITVCLCRFIG